MLRLVGRMDRFRWGRGLLGGMYVYIYICSFSGIFFFLMSILMLVLFLSLRLSSSQYHHRHTSASASASCELGGRGGWQDIGIIPWRFVFPPPFLFPIPQVELSKISKGDLI